MSNTNLSEDEVVAMIRAEDLEEQELDPEKVLMLSLLKRAMYDIRNRGETDDAWHYIMGTEDHNNSAGWMYSFINVCRELKINPRRVRAGAEELANQYRRMQTLKRMGQLCHY